MQQISSFQDKPILTSLSEVHKHIEKLFEINNIHVNDKISLLNDLQNRHRSILTNNKNEMSDVEINKIEIDSNSEAKSEILENVDIDIRDSAIKLLPKSSKNRANHLFDLIERSKIKYNNKNEVIINDKIISNSNILDLIYFTTVHKSKYSNKLPNGWLDFVDELKNNNIPKCAVANQYLWQTYFNNKKHLIESESEQSFKEFDKTKKFKWKEGK